MGFRFPILKPHEVIRHLLRHGFVEMRQRGSHRQFRHLDGRATTIAFHKGKDIKPAMLKAIAKEIGLTVDQLLNGP